ncbi:MAG: acyltransferase [Clostridia bacterium]|nr:acyltransferase [Clostridia bacterium]
MRKSFSFPKESSEMIKGVAILLMLFHHFFGFPNWYVEGISYIGVPLRVNTAEYVLGQFGHICVGIFAFLTGYGMFFSYQSGRNYIKSLKKLARFWAGYLLILFAIAIPLHYFVGSADISLKLILKNMIGYDTTLVPFGWYVRFYIAVMLTLPFIYRAMPRNGFAGVGLSLVCPLIINLFLSRVPGINAFLVKTVAYTMEYFLWLPCVLMGLCFAKYGLLGKIDKGFEKLKKGEHIACIVLLLAIMYLRAYKEDTIGTIIFSFDSFYVPLFVYICAKYLNYAHGFIKKILECLGRHSVNIWFLHSMFFFGTSALMKYAFLPKVSVLIIIWVICLCLPVSVVLRKASKGLFPKKQSKTEIKMEEAEKVLSLKG